MKKENGMITLYTRPSCMSSRKARSWLIEHGLSFYERRTSRVPCTRKEIQLFLRLPENGVSDLISKRSKVFREKKVKPEELEDCSLSQLIEWIVQYPNLLKYLIIVEQSKLMVGYHVDEMGLFLPKDWRKRELNYYYQSEKNLSVLLGEMHHVEMNREEETGL